MGASGILLRFAGLAGPEVGFGCPGSRKETDGLGDLVLGWTRFGTASFFATCEIALRLATCGALSLATLGALRIATLGALRIATWGALRIATWGALRIAALGALRVATFGTLSVAALGARGSLTSGALRTAALWSIAGARRGSTLEFVRSVPLSSPVCHSRNIFFKRTVIS